MRNINYRPDIDALRGVSVLLVVIYHAFPNIVPGGFIGVDIFFVISGYLITSIILTSIKKNIFSLKYFYSRRIKRLFPSLILVLCVTLLISWLILFSDEFKQLSHHVVYSSIYFLNFALIREIGYFDVEVIYKPLIHLWTLAVEEQYYIFWPILLIIILKQKIIKPIYFVALIVVTSFIANLYFIYDYPEIVYFHTLTRVWQLAIGSILAIHFINKILLENRIFTYTGLVLILATSLYVNDQSVYPGWLALAPTIGSALVIIGNIRLSQWFGMRSIGLISYPLYLWHWPILSFVYIYLGKNINNLIIVISILISFLLAYFTYKYIEPIRYSNKVYTTKILFLILMSIGLIGLYIKNNEGMPDRANLDYLKKINIEFVRTPAVDNLCQEYINNKLVNKRLFYYCRASNLNYDKYIAVIGDSHAHAIYPGIAKIAKDYNYGAILLANSGCPTLIGFESGKTDKEIIDCKKKIKQIFNILSNSPKVDKVFISTRGPVNIHGEVEGKFTTQNVKNSLSKTINDRQTYEYYSKGLGNTFKKLNGLDFIKNIYYFLENPELDFLPKEVVPRPFDKWNAFNRNTMDKSLYIQRMSNYRDIVTKQSKIHGVELIDPISYLCDDYKCFSYKEENFLYADDDHFSVFGSNYVATKMKNKIFN